MASPFIDAARVAGAGRWRLVFRHVLPHLYPLAALYMMLAVVGAVVAVVVLLAAALVRLGLRPRVGRAPVSGGTGTPAF